MELQGHSKDYLANFVFNFIINNKQLKSIPPSRQATLLAIQRLNDNKNKTTLKNISSKRDEVIKEFNIKASTNLSVSHVFHHIAELVYKGYLIKHSRSVLSVNIEAILARLKAAFLL